MSMNKLLHVTPIDTHDEIVTEVRYYPDQPVYGMQGYYSEGKCISMYDIDTQDFDRVMDIANDFITPSLLYKTKKGYHLYNFEIVTLKSWAEIGLHYYDDIIDIKHIGYSLCKGYPTLRVGMKPRSYNEPDIEYNGYVITNYDTPYSIPVSWTHFDHVTQILPMPLGDWHRVNHFLKKCNLKKYSGKLPLGIIYR